MLNVWTKKAENLCMIQLLLERRYFNGEVAQKNRESKSKLSWSVLLHCDPLQIGTWPCTTIVDVLGMDVWVNSEKVFLIEIFFCSAFSCSDLIIDNRIADTSKFLGYFTDS